MVNIIAALNAAQSVAQTITTKPGTSGGDLAHQGTLAGLFTGAVYVAIAAGVIPASMTAWAPMAAGLLGAIIWHLLPDKQQQVISKDAQDIAAEALAIPTLDSSPEAFPNPPPANPNSGNLTLKQP